MCNESPTDLHGVDELAVAPLVALWQTALGAAAHRRRGHRLVPLELQRLRLLRLQTAIMTMPRDATILHDDDCTRQAPLRQLMILRSSRRTHLLSCCLVGWLVELCSRCDIWLRQAETRHQGGNARCRQLLHNLRRQLLALPAHGKRSAYEALVSRGVTTAETGHWGKPNAIHGARIAAICTIAAHRQLQRSFDVARVCGHLLMSRRADRLRPARTRLAQDACGQTVRVAGELSTGLTGHGVT